MEDEVVKGVGGPTAGARELVQGDVGPEPGRVVRCEGVADGKSEGGGGGVPCVAWHVPSRVGVIVGGDGCRPKGVVGAVGGVEKGVFVGPRGCTEGGVLLCLPVASPVGEGALPSNGLGVCRGLNPVKGCAGGEVACHKRLEPCHIVRDLELLGW